MIDQIFVVREGRGCGSRHFSEREGRGESRERHEHGYRGGRHWGFEHRGHGGRERFFDAGDIKLVILKLLSEQPSYGYQLIKTMEERLAGGYTPSAGVIYPTLTLLEEEGLATASAENNRKVYSVTPEGLEYLQAHKRQVDELFERLEEAGKSFERGRSPEIRKAFMNLRSAVLLAARMINQKLTDSRIPQPIQSVRIPL